MSEDRNREFDVVIFGGTGFTGEYTVEHIANNNDRFKLRWAIAGRNKSKLAEVLDRVSKITGKDVKNVPIIVADVSDEKSLAEMCQRTKLVLNVVGPYRFYGEPVVKACIENKTHHIDISGEPIFLEQMQLKYDEAAKKAGVYVLGAAGFDSIPCETGIQYLRQHFDGDLNSVEDYIQLNAGPDGSKINSGTWKSAVYGLPDKSELRPIRQVILNQPRPVPKPKHVLKPRFPLFYNNDLRKWCLTFPVTDKSVVNRTNHFNYNYRQMRPVQMYSYLMLPTLLLLIPLFFIGLMFSVLRLFKFGQDLLAKYPSIFTFGMFSNDGPTRKQVETSSFSMFLVGEGHQEKLSDPDDQHQDAPTKKLIVRVDGPEAAYVATPICMVEAARVVLEEQDKLPNNGGVITPGAALWNTTLIERLQKSGMKYSLYKNE